MTLPISCLTRIKLMFNDCYKDLFGMTMIRLKRTYRIKMKATRFCYRNNLGYNNEDVN